MNFRRILSKSSLKSSSSSGKDLPSSETFSRLQAEIESLKHTIQSLKVTLENKDAFIGKLAREKEKLFVELKSVQRTNRNVHQQLIDERDIHSKEKEFLIQELKRLTNKNEYEINITQEESIEEDSYTLKEEIKAKDKVICNICTKYMKIKSSKMILQKKYDQLLSHCQKICKDIISHLQENRDSLDTLLQALLKYSTISPSSNKYLRILKENSKLRYENTQLKVCLSFATNDTASESYKQYYESSRSEQYPINHSKSEELSKRPKSNRKVYSPNLEINHDSVPVINSCNSKLKTL